MRLSVDEQRHGQIWLRLRTDERLVIADTKQRLSGWNILATTPGRRVVTRVCTYMADDVERRRGPPLIVSPEGAIRFWRIERYRDVALSRERDWTLDDGTRLRAGDPVLELHLRGDRLIRYLARREPWWNFVSREFSAVVPALYKRPEIAIVGSTILRKQVVRFGASTRTVPLSFHTFLDTFYRKLILLAFHPGSVTRVLSEDQPLVDAAISVREFCHKYRSVAGVNGASAVNAAARDGERGDLK